MNLDEITEDIFKNWKENKFVLLTAKDIGLISDYPYLIVLADIGYWNEHNLELIEWCEENNCRMRGMTVEVISEQAALLFSLKWS
jgi:hypothetical protein